MHRIVSKVTGKFQSKLAQPQTTVYRFPCSCPCGEFKLKKPDIVFDLINLTLILTCSNTSHVCGQQQHTLKEFNLGYFQTTVVKL